ncbi:sigma-70 family RNA polymerase sigma factor [Anatilimnocola sp. NA78]|uniref:sigma-70 family RNA polymerase sigma factor n=1 Tax=Anatilimnocola sp. NA78 TaxID=3415683 RepID=UPI003CE55854
MDPPHDPNQDRGPSSPGIDAFTRNYVQKFARRVIGKFGFRSQDREDIQQQLYLKLVKRLPKRCENEPKWKAFLALAVRRQIANMVRDRQAEKRDYRRTCALPGPRQVDGPDPAPIRACDTPSRKGSAERSELDQLTLRIDVTECIASLPDPRHREFCERLQEDSIAQVAKDMEVPRTTLNSWLSKLRCRFEARGLEKYL